MLTLTFPTAELLDNTRRAERALAAERTQTIHRVGDKLLQFARADYAAKSRGGTGTDGITWAPDTRETIELRVRASAAGKQIVNQRKQLAAQINATRGRGAGPRVAQLRAERAALSAKLQAMVDAAAASVTIGVETGEEQASAALEVDRQGLTLSYDAPNSAAFDADRPLLPARLPATWRQAADQIVRDSLQKILDREM